MLKRTPNNSQLWLLLKREPNKVNVQDSSIRGYDHF